MLLKVTPDKSNPFYADYFSLKKKLTISKAIFLPAYVGFFALLITGAFIEPAGGVKTNIVNALSALLLIGLPAMLFASYYSEKMGELVELYHPYGEDDAVKVDSLTADYLDLAFTEDTLTREEFKNNMLAGYRSKLKEVYASNKHHFKDSTDTYIGIPERQYNLALNYAGFTKVTTANGANIVVPVSAPTSDTADFYIYSKNHNTGKYDYYTTPTNGKQDHKGMVESLPTLHKEF